MWRRLAGAALNNQVFVVYANRRPLLYREIVNRHKSDFPDQKKQAAIPL